MSGQTLGGGDGMRFRCSWCLGVVWLLLAPGAVAAQETQQADLINLFFDCQAPSCRDEDYFRRELPFVHWVLDREVADVHNDVPRHAAEDCRSQDRPSGSAVLSPDPQRDPSP